LTSLTSGAVAGIAVDVSLFPLDTIKTRLQAKEGFVKSGGLKNIYAGLGPAAAGSAPNAALFFVTYEAVKLAASRSRYLAEFNLSENDPRVHMLAASLGEVNACLIRVPVEIIKQRRQATSSNHNSSMALIKQTWKLEGPKGFYRGYLTTVMREIPFSFIQFPMWEGLKNTWKAKQAKDVEAWQSAVCGSVAGGVSAG
jgi:solute carrier family 25 S-adenosylmethionine transporter 26